VDRRSKRIPCTGLADPLHLATGRVAASQQSAFVADQAAGLAASAIDSEKEGHKKILTAEFAKQRKDRKEDRHSRALLCVLLQLFGCFAVKDFACECVD